MESKSDIPTEEDKDFIVDDGITMIKIQHMNLMIHHHLMMINML